MMHCYSRLLLVATVVGSLLACGPADKIQDEQPLPVDPNGSVTIVHPVSLQAVAGEAAIEVAVVLDRDVKKMELFVTDIAEPVAVEQGLTDLILWDTHQSPVSEMQQIYVRVTDKWDHTYDSAPIEVIVMGANGRVMTMTDGASGDINIPANTVCTASGCNVEIDVKHHYTMPAGMTRIIGVGRWEKQDGQADWDIQLDLGTGFCPHSGETWRSAHGTQSPVILAMDIPSGAAGQSFIHLKPLIGTVAPNSHLGESIPYSVEVYLFE